MERVEPRRHNAEAGRGVLRRVAPVVLAMSVVWSRSARAGCPLGLATDTLPAQSVPIDTVAVPGGVGLYVDATGDVSTDRWWAVTDVGVLLGFTGPNATPDTLIDTGLGEARSITLTPDGLTLGTATALIEGQVSAGTWTTTNVIVLNGASSNATALDWYQGGYFGAFGTDGLWRIAPDGSVLFVSSLAAQSLDYHPFDANTFCADLLQGGGAFHNVDTSGVPLLPATAVAMGELFPIVGTAVFSDGAGGFGMAVVQGPGVQIHDAFSFMPFVSGLAPGATVGDLNCDGTVDVADVQPFVLALSDPAAYQQAFPGCDSNRADVNGDSFTDGGDVAVFVGLLLNP
ncbi:MAG: hypothetical protein ACE5F9_00215 [Phycisphaerae bacterium]